MGSLKKIISFEVVRTLKKKSFWISSLAVPVFAAAIGSLIYFSDHTTSQQAASLSTKHASIVVLDDSGLVSKPLLSKLHIAETSSQQAGIHDVAQGKVDAFIYYPRNVAQRGITVSAKQTSATNSNPYNTLAAQLLKQSVVLKVATVLPSQPQALSILQADPGVHTAYYKNGVMTPGFQSAILPGVFAVIFLVLLILLANQMVTSVTEEKENRVAEILLTSVKSQTVIIGKILSISLLGLVQLVMILIPLLIADITVFRHSSFVLSHIPLEPMRTFIALVYATLGFTLFTGLLVGIGAMSPTAKESGPFIAVTYIWTYAPFYILGLLFSSSTNIVVTIFTYFPLTAPTTVLLRNALNNLNGRVIAITLPMLAVAAVLAILFAIRAFTSGAMEFNRRLNIKKLYR